MVTAKLAQEHAKVVIVGAGFSGLAMAIRLEQQGIDDYVILERADDVGGTWHYNTYPGCMCDVPSHLYSLSFAPNPAWSHTYSPQAEIRAYLQGCAEEFGIRGHLRTNVEVEAASWREDEELWDIDTSAGTFTANVLVAGMGPLTEPMIPALPGLARFQGKTMHSARWDHDYELAGKRVASIGTGASAIQYVPEIRPLLDRLYVFQRTAPWVMPHGDRPITELERMLYRRVPFAQRLVRASVYAARELLVLGFAKDPRLMGMLERLARSHMRRHISDPDLLERVTPDYTLGCKRILPSNRWYPALGERNVELVTDGIEEIRERCIVDARGVEREVDAIIFGTGFHVTDIPGAQQVRGRDGKLISEVWRGSPRAYLGTAVPGFPNLFLLLGPNTGLGHSSMVYMIESQVEHVLRAILAMERSGATTIEVRPQAHAEFNRVLDERMRGTVWDTGGCTSFYLDETGRNATLWPDWTWRFRRLAARFDSGAYTLRTRRPATLTA
ncbi:MAG: NAD(P)/FAD-dependent oxidoreductase [Actinomycetota bacterium]|nr:NAD(P)/FAD-dependent oxidoreductase [Actinomycetota bacterium]